ncbi:hypothetical protein Cgig2_017685 [Carnegiea gigantea]|uniref:Uncharacterized protein n=1 Tax=Carnegiea gigantea TaxID=171969 RepID=A0A9Q1GN78_9CARY|nr:hypothetical protein Cgig2_017685 [Carnegiea gigantea]
MIIFMDKTTSGQCYLHIQPSESDIDGEEIKLPNRSSIASLCKSDESSHTKVKENLPSYQLLRHHIESGHKSWVRLPVHGEFSYKPLYWEWLEDILVARVSQPQSNGLPSGFVGPTTTMFPRSLIKETEPSSRNIELVRGVIIRSFSMSWEWLKTNVPRLLQLHFFHVGYAYSSCQLEMLVIYA